MNRSEGLAESYAVSVIDRIDVDGRLFDVNGSNQFAIFSDKLPSTFVTFQLK